MNQKLLLLAGALLAAFTPPAGAQYPGWQHTGSLFILTTPEGANLPATASVVDFPLLVRLHQGTFDFSQARAKGEDLRFSADGKPLAYQIEEWDAARGAASIWVRIPVIQGNARQEIKMYWGQPDAASESSGSAVFNASNGYLSVWHLGGSVNPLKDEVGTLTAANVGTTVAPGIIGQARHFTGGQGIHCGENITTYPANANPHSSEAWIRADRSGTTVLGWGNEKARGKVVMQLASPPHVNMDCYFSRGNVEATSILPLSQWIQVVHTYQNGDSRIYVNGVLDGVGTSTRAPLAIQSPAKMWIGGWWNNYSFVGDIDEVRISQVARSADWIRLQYENQKPLQTLVGTVVSPGNAFSVSAAEIKVAEGKSATVTARAGGAQKVYWVLKRDGAETVAAVDQYAYTLEAGRVVADTALVLQFKAVYAQEVKTRDIPVTIQEAIPEPEFTLRAPGAWNGRDSIEVIPIISNLAAMKAKNVGDLKTTWTVSGGAVIKESLPDKLILKRSQCSGKITVRLALNNGGADAIATTNILVTEPKQDAWVQRTPGLNEKPENNQFYARDDKNEGTLYYNGTLDQAADAVFLKVYAGDKLLKTESRQLAADRTYAFAVKLTPGLIKYRVEFGAKAGGVETVLRTATNLVCGDAYIIQGQSNAEATGPNNGPTIDSPIPLGDWIRSYGNASDGTPRGGWGNAFRTRIWGKPDYGFCQIGAWGMVLASNLVARYGIPICILNGAVGGTRIDQHQRNEADHRDPATLYGRLLTRLEGAKLTHGIRGVLWHQGENNQGSASPTGDYDWKSYQQYFIDLSAAWKQDCPNIQHYYLYQIWPSGCNMGGTPAGDMLLEVQRTLPALFSNLRIMSTLGIVSGSSGRGLCHFDLEGYAQMAQLLSPLVEQDNYGLVPPREIAAPNLRRAWFTTAARNEIALDFGQPMAWKDGGGAWINLDNQNAPLRAGQVSGPVITLELTAPTAAKTISYLSGKNWDGRPDRLLYGANGIAALAFSAVTIEPSVK